MDLFPILPGLTWNVGMSPGFKTNVQTGVSGRELRGSFQLYPKWTFTLTYEFLKGGNWGNDLQTLGGFFLRQNGMNSAFLYDNPEDDTVANYAFATGIGTVTAFQLTRSFGASGMTFVEPVQNLNIAPIAFPGTSPTVYKTDWEGQQMQWTIPRINGIVNNQMTGGVAGSPGTPPTNWIIQYNNTNMDTAGLTQTLAYSTENGQPTIDITISGTPTVTASYDIYFEGGNIAIAQPGVPCIVSTYARLLSGSLTNVSSLCLEMYGLEQNGGTGSGDNLGTSNLASQVSSTLTRLSLTAIPQSPSTAYFRPILYINLTSGEAVNFTLRLYGMQIENTFNLVQNPAMVGGAAGSPGAVPTRWVQGIGGSGVAQTLAYNTENGYNTLDVNLAGTATVGGAWTVELDRQSFLPPTAKGQQIVMSLVIKLQAGSLGTGISEYFNGVYLRFSEFDQNGNFLGYSENTAGTDVKSQNLQGSITGTAELFTFDAVVTYPTTVFIQPTLYVQFVAGGQLGGSSSGATFRLYSPACYLNQAIATGATSNFSPQLSSVIANTPVSETLSAAITSTTQTSISVSGHLGFPISGNFDIQIGTEYMTVTAGQGTNTWTVTRGMYGTAPGVWSSGTVLIYLNDAPDYSLNGTGLVTFTEAPVGSLSWSGSFYYRVRFLQDSLDFEEFMQDLWQLKKLEFIGAPGNMV